MTESIPSTFVMKDTIWLGAKGDDRLFKSICDYSRTYLHVTGISLELYAAHFQYVLTFGVLEAVVGIKIPEEAMLSINNEGKTVLTAAGLPQILQSWRKTILAMPEQDCLAEALRSARELRIARQLLQLDIFHPHKSLLYRSRIQLPDIAAMLSGIACVAEFISASWSIFKIRLPGVPALGLEWSFARDILGQLAVSMTSSGWCPFLLRSIEGTSALQYASKTAPPRGDVCYSHNLCTPTACVVNNIDTTGYTVRHVSDDCACVTVVPPIGEVVRIIEEDEIPVLRMRDSDGVGAQPPVLTVAPSSAQPYVCISHVWSDGLGSTTEEGLPLCQLKRVLHVVDNALDGGYFWMDSLCVPKDDRVRKRAISLMARTYQSAQVVVVFDSGIRACPPSAPPADRLLHVVTSAWMHRLWTLQEAMLARKLVFQFGGLALIDVEALIPVGDQLVNPLLVYLASELFRLRAHARRRDTFSLTHISRALKRRSTSRTKDETLAISGLLGVDAFTLAKIDSGSQRMKEFLIAVRKMSRTIIFVLSARLDIPCFTWAPQTLMTHTDTSFSFSENDFDSAVCTERGLYAEYFAVLFDHSRIDSEGMSDWFVKEEGSGGLAFKLWTSPESPPLRPFACNSLLFEHCPRSSEITACIAATVRIPGDGEVCLREEDRFICKYMQRLIALRVSLTEVDESAMPAARVYRSGRMKVLMV